MSWSEPSVRITNIKPTAPSIVPTHGSPQTSRQRQCLMNCSTTSGYTFVGSVRFQAPPRCGNAGHGHRVALRFLPDMEAIVPQ